MPFDTEKFIVESIEELDRNFFRLRRRAPPGSEPPDHCGHRHASREEAEACDHFSGSSPS
jgi:hypothetical protein